MGIHAETTGSGKPLVLIHGFTQSARAWGPVLPALASRYRVTAIDAPGHGRSSHVEVGLRQGADLLAAAAPRPSAWLGYSMGGRYALHVALAHPEQVQRLILVSATGGIDDPVERRARRESDEALARRVESEGVERFVSWWVTQPLFASLDASLEGRLDTTASGLASSLRLAGTGRQEPLWDRLADLTMPVLVVAGALDRKYVELGERLAASFGGPTTLRVIDGAGHSCHLEKPAEFVAAVTDWLGS